MSFTLETDDVNNEIEGECGRIFLNIKGILIFHCTLCNRKFDGFLKYRNHIKNQHYYNIENDNEDELLDTVENELNIGAFENCGISNLSNIFEGGNLYGPMDNQNSQISTVNIADDVVDSYELTGQANLQAETSVLEEDEMDIKTLKKTKNIKVLKLKNEKLKRIIKKRKTCGENGVTVCPVCKEVLSKNTHLKTHLKRHSNEKNHKCTICSKAFFTRCELDTHMRSHTGERPFLCTSCGEAFTTASKLSAHLNQKHIRQRDKRCPICNMSFYSSVILKGHMIIHSDDRPFACEMCDSKFKRRKGLQSHMKMHENKKEYVCDMCPARFNQKCNLNSHRKQKHAIACDDIQIVYNIT